MATTVTKLRNSSKLAARTPTQMALSRFFRHPLAGLGLLLLALVLGFVFIGPFFYSEEIGNTPVITDRLLPPSEKYPFGTDDAGRSVLIRMIYGGQISLAVGIAAVSISITLGTLAGLISGYFGGFVDAIIMRVVDLILAFPTLLLLLLISNALATNTTAFNILGREISISVFGIVLLIGFTGWVGLSRIVRSQVLSLKEREFVLAAKVLGAENSRIIFTHILPNCLAPIIVTATLGVGGAIVTESYLSFLGFGVRPPTATWGNILELARSYFDDAWWLWVFSGGALMLVTLSINFLGDALRDAFDPKAVQ
jgi:peptide/nickel transport system permease protein